MNNTQKEILQHFGAMVLRWILVLAGSWLVKKGVIDEPTLDSITAPDMLLTILGGIIIACTGIWGYWRAKYAVALPKAALRAEPGTSLEVVKTEVKSKL